jgi:hypothetical protein
MYSIDGIQLIASILFYLACSYLPEKFGDNQNVL